MPWVDGRPREWQMEDFISTGVSHFDVTCKQHEDGSFGVEGSFKKCERVCPVLKGKTYGDEVEPIYTCDNEFYLGSTCEKSCPEGYKLKGKGWNKKKKCKVTWNISGWRDSGNWKYCVKE